MKDYVIDRKRKMFVYNDGEEIPIPEDKVAQVLRTPYAKEVYKKELEISKALKGGPLGGLEAFTSAAQDSFAGNIPEKLVNHIKSAIGVFTGSKGREGLSALEKMSDEYLALEDARKEGLRQRQEEYPIASGAGNVLGMAGELSLLRNVPGVAAFPLMNVAHSETPITEPEKLISETAGQAGLGYLADKFTGGLSKIASARGARNAARENIANIEARNLAETEMAAQATAADQARFAQQSIERDQAIQGSMTAQKAMNEEFLTSSRQSIDRIAKTMGKHAVSADVMGVEEFIENEIGRSSHAMDAEANHSSRFLNSIFKPNSEGKLTGEHIQKGMKALDEVIVTSRGATKEILENFRNKFFKEFPVKMANSYVVEKWAPKIADSVGNIENVLARGFTGNEQVYSSILPKLGAKFGQNLSREIREAVRSTLGSIKGSMIEGIENPELAENLSNAIRKTPSYQKLSKELESNFSKNIGGGRAFGATKEEMFSLNPAFKSLEDFINAFPNEVAQKVLQASKKYIPDILLDISTKSGVAEKAIQNIPKNHQTLPYIPPVSPAVEIRPSLQNVPELAPPQGLYEKLGAGLESMNYENAKRLLKSHGVAGGAGSIAAHALGIPLAKIGAIAGTGGAILKGLTSPTAAGEIIRGGINTSSRIISDVLSRAEKYSSYHDGIIDDPQERRSLTKEIEDDRNIPLEQKAVLQSKINRGKTIYDRLQ